MKKRSRAVPFRSSTTLRDRPRARPRYALALACCAVLHGPARADRLVGWGEDLSGSPAGVPAGDDYTAIAAAQFLGVIALRPDGSIVGVDAPSGTGHVAIAANWGNGYALEADGSIVAWGTDQHGQVSGAPTGTGFTAVAAGVDHACALRANGSIMGWGRSDAGSPPVGTGYTAVSAGWFHGLALRADGSIASWGDFSVVFNTPSGTGFTDIASGWSFGIALRADGSIVVWGDGDTLADHPVPPGTDFVDVESNGWHGIARRADGSIVVWGTPSPIVTDAPTGRGFTALAGGGHAGFALTPVGTTFCDASDGALVACPCGNAGAPDAGCDIQQGTGGVALRVVAWESAPERVTMTGTGFPPAAHPAAVVLRSQGLDPLGPIPFGDGLRCIDAAVTRANAARAHAGVTTHVFGHGAGPGTFLYQLWFRNQPAGWCTPEPFNLSNGTLVIW